METEPRGELQGHGWRLKKPLSAGVEVRLTFLIALTIILLLLVLGWAYYQRYQTEKAQALRSEQEIAIGVATTFAGYVRDVRRQGATIGHALLALRPRGAQEANRLLAKAKAQYVSLNSINWVSSSGRVLGSSVPESIGLDLGDRAYFREIVSGREWAVSDLLQVDRTSGKPSFVIATGIRDQAGQLQGVVVISVDPTRLGAASLSQDRPGGAAYTIFDSQGALVYRRPEMDWTWEQRLRWKEQDPLLAQALKGNVALGEVNPVVARVSSFGARVPTELGWVVGTIQPIDTAMAPVRKAMIRDILFSGVVTAVALGLAVLIGRTIAGPLLRLEHDVQAFGEGDLSRRANPSGPSEVAQVAFVFNNMANELQAYQESLEERVRNRTAELEESNRELESFSYTVAHDLRSPLRALEGFSRYLLANYQEKLDERGRDYLNRINAAAQRMGRLIDDLLKMARISRETVKSESLDLSQMAADILAGMQIREPQRQVEAQIAAGVTANGDRELLGLALYHLLENAWKFTSTKERARITFGVTHDKGESAYFVQDNGIGFDMAYADKLFLPFHRLQLDTIFSGTGMGLAVVQRIIARHGGRVWAEGREGEGSIFYFTLGGTA